MIDINVVADTFTGRYPTITSLIQACPQDDYRDAVVKALGWS